MTALAAISLLAWCYLLVGRGIFWRFAERDEPIAAEKTPVLWPSVTAVVPARNEADLIGQTLASLVAQDYPGAFRILLVDDRSSDGTVEMARKTASALGAGKKVEILGGQERPAGWSGKLWALQQGLAQLTDKTEFLLFTDADIAHAPDNLRRLVVRAEERKLVLVSLMAKLDCSTVTDKLLIPAFVFFFAMLFPFGRVCDPARKTAAAAGGCMLVRRTALDDAGGLRVIAGAIIDDCALARVLKPQGAIWMGLTEQARSIRPYGGIVDTGGMVARSAYAQLGYSPVLLCGTVIGMLVVYAAPPLLVFFAAGWARVLGGAAWLVMALLYQPMLRFYRLSPLWGLLLPVTGACYTVFTMNSAIQHWRGRGGMWKGRAQAIA